MGTDSSRTTGSWSARSPLLWRCATLHSLSCRNGPSRSQTDVPNKVRTQLKLGRPAREDFWAGPRDPPARDVSADRSADGAFRIRRGDRIGVPVYEFPGAVLSPESARHAQPEPGQIFRAADL